MPAVMNWNTRLAVGTFLSLRFLIDLSRLETWGLQLLFDLLDLILLIGILSEKKFLWKMWIVLTCITTILKASVPISYAIIIKGTFNLYILLDPLDLLWYTFAFASMILVLWTLIQDATASPKKKTFDKLLLI